MMVPAERVRNERLAQLVPLSVIERLLGNALSTGGDFAEVYLENTRRNAISLQEEKIRSASYAVSLGVGVRVIAGDEVGYAYSDDLDPRALEQTAMVAAAIAGSGRDPGPIRTSRMPVPDHHQVDRSPDEVAAQDKVELLLCGDRAARAGDRRITQVIGSFVDETKDILIAHSDGVLSEDHQVRCRLDFTAVAVDARRGRPPERRVGSFGSGGRTSVERLQGAAAQEAAAEAARIAIAQLGAGACPAGPQTVVLSPGWSGILLHEAVGHGLEADFVRKRTSLYADRVGQRVASELVTVIDNGTLRHKRGSLNIDDEGSATHSTTLIENGVLSGYMVDRLSAQIMGMRATGNGRRQSYRHAPMPRMTNTYMAKGPHTHEEILASVDEGIYCAAFGGGQVDISNGNFAFEIREGYLIEHGKLTRPVNNASLIGVGPEALQRVTMVGDNPELDPGIGVCRKDGQTIPVGVGLPTVRLDGITVGGTELG